MLYFEQCINATASFSISELVVIKSTLKCFFGEVFVNYPDSKALAITGVIFIPLKSFFILGISTFGIGFILAVFHRLGHMDVANDIFQTFTTTGERMLAKSFHMQQGILSDPVAVRFIDQRPKRCILDHSLAVLFQMQR